MAFVRKMPMAPEGEYLSILQQGAGLADVSRATAVNSVVMMDPAEFSG